MREALAQWAHFHPMPLWQCLAWLGGGGLAAYVGWLRLGRRIHSRETLFETSRPFPLAGRPDLIMQEWGGLLVIHDLKTRKTARIYASDQLQLSLYALLVRRSTGRAVAPYGYIRLLVGGRVELSRVALVATEPELERLYSAFMSKAAAPESARLSAPAYLCRNCGFKGRQCPGKG